MWRFVTSRTFRSALAHATPSLMVAASLLLGPPLHTQAAAHLPSESKPVVTGTLMTLSGKVTSIDKARRRVVIESGDGRSAVMVRTKVESDTARQAAQGASRPGLAAAETTTMVANVFEVDRQRGVITLRGTDGVPVDINVGDKQALAQVEPGDQVAIGYREAMAVAIQPAGAADGAASMPPSR